MWKYLPSYDSSNTKFQETNCSSSSVTRATPVIQWSSLNSYSYSQTGDTAMKMTVSAHMESVSD